STVNEPFESSSQQPKGDELQRELQGVVEMVRSVPPSQESVERAIEQALRARPHRRRNMLRRKLLAGALAASLLLGFFVWLVLDHKRPSASFADSEDHALLSPNASRFTRLFGSSRPLDDRGEPNGSMGTDHGGPDGIAIDLPGITEGLSNTLYRGSDSTRSSRGVVITESLPDLGAIVISGNNPQDVEEVVK